MFKNINKCRKTLILFLIIISIIKYRNDSFQLIYFLSFYILYKMKENILDHLNYHKKWHQGTQEHRKKYKYSMNEDIIEYILKKINIKENGFFVEFGAMDGILGSNCRKIFEKGWKGMFIEMNFLDFVKLKKNYINTDIIIINKKVSLTGENTFDNIMKENNVKNIDFCSIDVDGLDLQIFKTIEVFLPTIVCIEGGQMLHPYEKEIPIDKEKQCITQSLSIFVREFEKKGYKILCAYQDIFFIKEEYYNFFNVETDIYQLYLDGLLALPRIPYIKTILNNVQLKNTIIEYISKNCDNSITECRDIWLARNYNIIKKNILYLKQNKI
jgi:hypothetical protein